MVLPIGAKLNKNYLVAKQINKYTFFFNIKKTFFKNIYKLQFKIMISWEIGTKTFCGRDIYL